MRNALLSMLVVLCGVQAIEAQVTPPGLIEYKGVLRDSATGLPLNATVSLVFTFYPGPSGTGTDILIDTHTGVVVTNGSYGVQLGGGSVIDGAGSGVYTTLNDLFRDFSSVWMEIRVTSPFAETLTPRVRMLGSAYALNAANSVDAARLGGNLPANYLDTSGSTQTKTGDLSVGSLSVSGSTTVSGAVTAPSLSVSGGINPGGGLVLPDGSIPLTGRTPLQIATLHWYAAASQNSVPVGTCPGGVAFDGANIWVLSACSGSLKKLRASDGALLGTFSGSGFDLTFDGANMWMSSATGVTKVRASDGAVQGNFAVGFQPTGLGFDGSNIWVANQTGNSVTKLRASDGAILGTFPVGASPVGMAFDGSNIWVANYVGGSVTKLRASDGANLGTFTGFVNPAQLVFDGSSIWVTDQSANNLVKLRASDGMVLSIRFSGGLTPWGLAFDGSNIWVANQDSDNVSKFRSSDAFPIGSFSTSSYPTGVAFDGSSIWVTNQVSGTVTKL